MSQTNITIPITVEHSELPGGLYSGTGRDSSLDPDTARYHFLSNPVGPPNGPFDPWKLREDFLSWPLEDWKAFISMTGCFGPVQVSKSDFGRWQKYLRAALTCPPQRWEALHKAFKLGSRPRLASPAFSVRFEWNGDAPIALIKAGNSLEAIIATIWVDALRGATFRTCARHDCKNPPFRVEARHKIFCSSDCAHLVAVRNSRERAAEAKGKASKKRKPQKEKRG